MAFGLDAGQQIIKEPFLQVGTWTNPDTIGNGVVGNPTTLFTGDYLGYARQGTTNIGMTRAYAEARSGTPSIKINKSLIQKDLMITLEEFQYNGDIFEHSFGMYTQKAYTAAGWTGDLGWYGSDEPGGCTGTQFNGYMALTETVDCEPIGIAIWYGKVTTEDFSVAFSGTDFTSHALQIEAFNSPDFGVTGVDAQKHYGMWWRQTS